MTMRRLLRVLVRDDHGGPLAEFALVIGLLFVVATAFVLARLGQVVARPFGEIPRREKLLNVFAGLANALLNLAALLAVSRISIALAVLVFYTYPAMVAAVSTLLFGEHLDRARWGALAVSLVGLVLVLVGAGQVGGFDPLGVALAFIGGVCQVIYALTARHGFHDPNNLCLVGALEDIAPRTRSQCGKDRIVVLKHRHDDDTNMRTGLHNLSCRLDPVDLGHLQIHQHNIRLQCLRQAHCIGAVRCFADNLHIRLGVHEHLYSFANCVVIFRQ